MNQGKDTTVNNRNSKGFTAEEKAALKALTAAEEARTGALVKKGVI